MEPFVRLTAVAAPIVRDNIDTDIIIPSREMKTVGKTGLADGLFAGWRYIDNSGREPNPEFVLNVPAFAGAKIILGGDNFGSGSSREHAVWALHEYGVRCVIAPGFSPIFENNCIRNGLLPVRLPRGEVEALAAAGNPLTVDLPAQTVTGPDGVAHAFEIAAEPKLMLLEGLDVIDLTLKRAADISAWRDADRARRPWIYL